MWRSRTVVNIQNLIDDIKCFETVRQLRWPEGVTCPHCASSRITKQGHDTTQPERQRYQCQACQKLFDDLTGTIFAGHHQPLRVWILCLYFMGLNLSNEQRLILCFGGLFPNISSAGYNHLLSAEATW